MPLRALADRMRQRGHRVIAALRELAHAPDLFGSEVELVQAPVKRTGPRNPIVPTYTFAQVIHNVGFEDEIELAPLAEAWRALFHRYSPHLVVFEHAPVALLAARGMNFKRVVTGNGFMIPPDVSSLPNLCAWESPNPSVLERDEQRILALANQMLQRWGETPLTRLTRLYAEADERFLMTFPELDHYPARRASRYWGTWSNPAGKSPVWPTNKGQRIYAYLKNSRALPQILTILRNTRQPILAYIDGIEPELRRSFESQSMIFALEPLDLTQVARQCDLAILTGGHASTCTMLLAGKPTLQLPIFLEQMMMADAVTRHGMGLGAESEKPRQVEVALSKLLSSGVYSENAKRFASRYASFNPTVQQDAMARRVHQLLSPTARASSANPESAPD